MECQKCKSERILNVNGKTSDCFNAMTCFPAPLKCVELSDYPPMDIGIGGNDYIEFSYCLECGQIQGEFPLTPDFDDWK